MSHTLTVFIDHKATSQLYTLSLHDALPICAGRLAGGSLDESPADGGKGAGRVVIGIDRTDRKSTRLNSSHANISYAVFCLKKKRCADGLIVYLRSFVWTMATAALAAVASTK